MSETNPFENHRSFWSRERLGAAGAVHIERQPASTVALFGDVAEYDTGTSSNLRWRDWLIPPAWQRILRELKRRLRESP